MSKVGKMAGSKWHQSYLSMSENDSKRHRSRCVYYKGKESGGCSYYCVKCHGSSHCAKYIEKIDHSDVTEQIGKSSSKKTAVAFREVQNLKLSDIIVPMDKKQWEPTKAEFDRILSKYNEKNSFDYPIVVRIEDGKYVLADKFIEFKVASYLNLETIPAEMGSLEEIEQRDALRTVGCLVWDKKQSDAGVVIQSTHTRVTIQFDSGNIGSFGIYTVLKNERIMPLL